MKSQSMEPNNSEAIKSTAELLEQMDLNDYSELSERQKEKLYNPLNIFFVKKVQNASVINFVLHLDSPIQFDNDQAKETIDKLKIKVSSLLRLKDILGFGFEIISESYLVPLNRISRIDKGLEKILLRRYLLSEEDQQKFKLRREIWIPASRKFVHNFDIRNFTNHMKFSRNSLREGSLINLPGIMDGINVLFNPADIAYMESRKDHIKHVQFLSILKNERIYPAFKFKERKSLKEIIGRSILSQESPQNWFIQINRFCFVNINCLFRATLSDKPRTLRFRLGPENFELKVGAQYLDQIQVFFCRLKKDGSTNNPS